MRVTFSLAKVFMNISIITLMEVYPKESPFKDTKDNFLNFGHKVH